MAMNIDHIGDRLFRGWSHFGGSLFYWLLEVIFYSFSSLEPELLVACWSKLRGGCFSDVRNVATSSMVARMQLGTGICQVANRGFTANHVLRAIT